jgi:hypothetical protein
VYIYVYIGVHVEGTQVNQFMQRLESGDKEKEVVEGVRVEKEVDDEGVRVEKEVEMGEKDVEAEEEKEEEEEGLGKLETKGSEDRYDDDDDDVYFRLQHGKGFHSLVYLSYVKHIIQACKA